MEKIFSKLMTIIFAASLALFIMLGVFVIVLGPKRTESAIKALFKLSNYEEGYQRIYPVASKEILPPDSGNEPSVLGAEYLREVRDISSVPPFIVPSSGTIPVSAFLYTGPLSEGKHEGIDIWTSVNGSGIDGGNKGNPVYAACSGEVTYIWEANGDVSIRCDTLDSIYTEVIPSLEIKTLYGHMADQFSNEVYINVALGQRVEQGDLIGFQGNRCYWSLQNRVVHLHFSVYDVSVQPQKPLDPEPYIGVSCTTLNQDFVAGVK
ncbi:MAG: M23 family metallopeptidase [Patescibacteria group bacterium]|nr:M23 family metallopeptidase [Patescibacteria group bacterium]